MTELILAGGAFFVIAVQAFCFFMLWRNSVVFRARIQALDAISARVREDIDAGNRGAVDRWYGRFDAAPSYAQMMWAFTKWRFADFYPWLADEQQEAA